MNLHDELERVREYLTNANPPPANEANTCDWVIRPLLLQCGYHYHDIHAQGHDAAGNIPDYTILPNTPHTWFLEAKAWQVSMTDTHVNQAANYVNTTAKRWFVVSNGREWRLYDNYNVQVPPPERLVAIAKLDCGTELEDLLGALSKTSVQSGGLEQYALRTRLDTVLQQELGAENSDVIQAIIGVLKHKSGLPGVTPVDVAAYFHDLQPSSSTTSPSLQSSPAHISSLVIPTPYSTSSSDGGFSLPELRAMGDKVHERKPESLTFPDGTSKTVTNWRRVLLGIIEWLLTKGKTPALPFRGLESGFRDTIWKPSQDGSENTNFGASFVIHGQTYYVFTDRADYNKIIILMALCKEVGESPDGFRVILQ